MAKTFSIWVSSAMAKNDVHVRQQILIARKRRYYGRYTVRQKEVRRKEKGKKGEKKGRKKGKEEEGKMRN